MFKPDFLCLVEPKIPLVARDWNWAVWSFVGSNVKVLPSIQVFTMERYSISFVVYSDQHVTFQASKLGRHYTLIVVYGDNLASGRCRIWKDLLDLQVNGPWFAIGDFTGVKGSHEKKDGSINVQACREFISFMDDAELTDLQMHGSEYTWTNGRRGTDNIQC